MSRTDDLAALFAQARPVAGMTGATSVSPSSGGVQLRQGTLLAWNPSTGESRIDVGGTVVENIPILIAESLALSVGDVVAVLTSGSSWFLFGRIATPGSADAVFKVGTGDINFDARDINSSTTFYSDEEPTSPVTGDVWFDTNDGNKLYRYDGTAWVAAELGGSALAADAIDGRTITGSLVRTAASGERVEIGDNPDIGGTADNEVRFYTGEPIETFPGKITAASSVPGSAVMTLFGPDMVTDGGRLRLWTNDSSGSSVELAADAIDLFANVSINSGGLLDHTGDAAVSGALSVGGLLSRIGEEDWNSVLAAGAGDGRFQNSWTNSNPAAGRNARYRLYADGDVMIELAVSGGSSAAAVMFTLPVGYRPPRTFATTGTTSAGGNVRMVVATTGAVSASHGGSTSQTDAIIRFSTLA